MAVQPQLHSHAFLDEYTRCAPAAGVGDTTLLRDFPRSDLACNYYGFEPRKRSRMADGFLEDQCVGVALSPAAMVQRKTVRPLSAGDDAPCGALASTSGRAAGLAGGSGGLLLSRMCNQGVEIDALVRLQSERIRAGLQEARRRHARELLAAAERAASGRLRAAEAELERALGRNAELEDRARQMAAECQAWMGVARSHEAVAAGLRATLDQLLQLPCACATAPAGTVVEDAQSCCFVAPAVGDANDDDAASGSRAAASSCKRCRGGEACVLLLPCRHLCVCAACEVAVDACPVCAAAKNASIHVLLS